MRLKSGMTWSVFSSQNLTVRLNPGEPWIASTAVVFRPVVVNLINLAVIAALLALFIVGSHRRWLSRLASAFRLQRVLLPQSSPAPVSGIISGATSYSNVSTGTYPARMGETAVAPSAMPAIDEDVESSAEIFHGYREALKLIQRLARLAMAPQQTLSEFARQTDPSIGSAAKPFAQLTKITERLMYSRHKPTAQDATRSRRLSHSIKEVLSR
jgi:hypothetical protein